MKDIEQTIKNMTLDEKCAFLSGKKTFATRAFAKHDIPEVMLTDGTSGLRKQSGASDHLGLNGSEPATCFPTIGTVSASWDEALAQQVGTAMGKEAAAGEVSVLLAPALNIKRNPLGGRNFEYVSEDPYISGKIAAAYVRGIQSNGTAACPKHFAVNSQELRRMASDSVVDERTLREIYLTAFEIVVKEAHPYSLMTSYNMVNGTYTNENRHLLIDILRDDWGFDGAVVTDWGGSNDHALGVKNGSTLEMPAPGNGSVLELKKAVEEGIVSEADVDARVREMLTLLERTAPAREGKTSFSQEEHHELACRAAREGTVLLKNEGGVLPVGAGESIALIGEFAKIPRFQGEGSSKVNSFKVTNIFDELGAAGADILGYAPGYERNKPANEALMKEAAELAAKADKVIICAGLEEIQESEGLDRADLKIPDNQTQLISAVAAANKNTIVLIAAGGPIEMPWIDIVSGILYQGLGGQAGAQAAAEIVMGKVNPSGKLTETWPIKYEDVPCAAHFPSEARTSEYREGLYVGYRYYETAKVPVQYPFGYGLSYTSFEYSNMTVSADGVSLTVTNTGSMAGTEVVQIYVSKNGGNIFAPELELKAFARVTLEPGQSKAVEIPLDDKAFRYWNVETDCWETESGSYSIMAAASCEDIRLCGQVLIEGSELASPYDGKPIKCYESGKADAVTDEEFEAILGHEIPEAVHKKIDRSLTVGELGHGRSPIGWLVAFIINHINESNKKKGKTDLNILFICNMPLRAIAKMTSGMVNMRMVDAIVMELKGFWIIGIIRLIYEFIRNMIVNASYEKKLN